MWYAYLGRLFSKIGTQMAAALGAILAVLGLVWGHRRRVDSAGKAGRKEGAESERERIQQDTERESEYLERRRDEIKDKITRDTATDSDLRDRMRAAATRPSDKP